MQYTLIKSNLDNKSPFILWRWNLAAGIVHLLSGIAALILTTTTTGPLLQSVLTSDFTKLVNGSNINMGLAPTFEYLQRYSPVWVILPFHFITAFFHFIVLFPGVYLFYLYQTLGRGINYFTWIEYCITPVLMTWALWALSGGSNIIQGITLIVLNTNMILLGAAHEYIHRSHIGDWKSSYARDLGVILKEKASLQPFPPVSSRPFPEQKVIEWYNIILSFFNFAFIWVIIFCYFFVALASAKTAPWYVWTINIGIFFQYLSFGLHMVFHFMAKNWIINNPSYNSKSWSSWFYLFYSKRLNYTAGYILLSLTSKLFLTWVIWGGTLTAR
jgi:hypothetical protein